MGYSREGGLGKMAIDRDTNLFTFSVDVSGFNKAVEEVNKSFKRFGEVVKDTCYCPLCNQRIRVGEKRQKYKGKVYHYNCLLMKVDKKGRSKDLLMKRLY